MTNEELFGRIDRYTQPYAMVPVDMGTVSDLVSLLNVARAAIAASPVPAGYKLVPVEPTLDMNRAARVNMEYRSCTSAEIWAAMLAAAPSAPAQQAEESLDQNELYRLQMAAISTAAFGYWKLGDPIKDEYVTVALKDVASLYEKYDALFKAAAAPAPSVEAQADAPIYRGTCPSGDRCIHGCHSNEPCYDKARAVNTEVSDALLNRLIELGAKAAHEHAKSNSDDGHAGTEAYGRWHALREEMRAALKESQR